MFAEGPRAGAIINVEALTSGGPPVRAWAMEPGSGVVRNQSRNGQILLVRLKPDGRVVGFSALCTHAGCAVIGWKPETCQLLCPCHGSVYDPAADGRVVSGPAPRPLPALTLWVDGGTLTVAAGFTALIGGYTGRTD